MTALTSVSGFPRIGSNRELKKVIEGYWKGAKTLEDVRTTAKQLRANHWKLQQEAGIDIQIRSTEFASQLRDQQQGKFQMSRVGWSGRIDPDGNIHPFAHSKGNQNDGKYANAEVDKLLDEARTIYEPAERKKRYDAAQKILQDELPIVYLYNQTVFFAMRSNLQGFAINPDGIIRLAGMKRS